MIFDSAFSPDSKYLASADESGTLVVWDIASRKMLFRIEDTDAETYGKPIFSPDGKLLAAVETLDGGPTVLLGSRVRFWDAKTGKPLASPTDSFKDIDDMAFSPDSQLLVAQTDFNSTTIWNLSTLKVQKPSFTAAGPYAFDRMGTKLAASADRK
jgi:WD40 repeat protein